MGWLSRARIGVLGSFAAVMLLAAPAAAADLYWFGDGATLGGTGNWSAAATNWSTTTPAPTLTMWDPGSTAVFQGSAGAVTITDANIDAALGLRFDTDLYTLGGGSLTLTGAASALNAISVAAAATATCNAVVAGANGLTKLGPGTFVLAAANTYGGETVVEGGTLRVTGSTNTAANTYVGYVQSDTALEVSSGGTVTSLASYLAVIAGSANNMATVSGAGSTWTTTNDLVIGYAGAANALTVSAGGAVAATTGFIGFEAAAGMNAVTVTGADSEWMNSGVLYVGHDGADNSFLVESGGYALSGQDAVLGFTATSSGNSLTVRDAGSRFEVASPFTLIIGDDGDNNELEISAGGAVTGHNARLGRSAASSGNTATITGPASQWTNTGTIRVGALGGGNAVTVAAGGAVSFDGNAFIGHGAGAPNNTVTVEGAGSTWNSGPLTVGLSSTGNVLTVRSGGAVTATELVIAANAGSGGTVNIGSGGAAGVLNAPIEFGDGSGVVNFNHSDPAFAFSQPISGPGAVNYLGSGTTIVSAPHTYSGGTTLSAGTLRLAAGGALPSSGPFVLAGGTLDLGDQSAVLGDLSLEGSAILRFSPGGAAQTVTFASAAWVGGTLSIVNWNSEQDQLIITADPGPGGILDHIQFAGYPPGAQWFPGSGQVRPPESRVAPAPLLSPLGLALAIALLGAIAAYAMRCTPRGTAA